MNDHDLLIEIHAEQKSLKEQFSNHLKHHFMVTLISLGATLSLIATLIVFIVTK